ncbi:MAG: glycosyltransferase [Akkermansia sp.]|nr:glycosyltransferase [Akkermansia sp.]
MNILFVYLTAIIPTRGGTERVTYCVSNSLQEKGHNIYYLSTDASSEDQKQLQATNYFFINPELDIEERKKIIRELCQKHQIDVIINEWGTWDDFSIFSKDVLLGTKIITCLHYDVYGVIKYKSNGRSTNPLKRLIVDSFSRLGINLYRVKRTLEFRARYRKMLMVSDAVVVVTPIIAKQLKRLTGIHSEKIVPIFNPLPLENIVSTYDTASKEKMLLFVGRLSPEKNVDLLLKAWAKIAPRYPEWKLEIAGSGNMQDNLLQLVGELKILRVQFHGHVEDVGSLYNRAEYLVLPSKHESFSCVVLESMAYGCHPIVFDYPSAPVVIPNSRLGTRIKHSTKALAKAMSKAIQTNTSNREHMEEVAAHLASFDMKRLANEWLALLDHVSEYQKNG